MYAKKGQQWHSCPPPHSLTHTPSSFQHCPRMCLRWRPSSSSCILHPRRNPPRHLQPITPPRRPSKATFQPKCVRLYWGWMVPSKANLGGILGQKCLGGLGWLIALDAACKKDLHTIIQDKFKAGQMSMLKKCFLTFLIM